MYREGSDVTLRDVYGFLATAMKTEQVPQEMKKEAALMLLKTGWAEMLGVTKEAVELLGTKPPEASPADALYTDDMMLDDRV